MPDRQQIIDDRRDAVLWARDMLERDDWVALDLETTGVEDYDEAIQIAIVSPPREVLFESLVKPRRRTMHPAAQAKTNITMLDLDDAPTIAEIMPDLARILAGKTIVTFNAAFDGRLLRQTAERHGKGLADEYPIPGPWSCAMLQYSKFVGQWDDSKASYKWQRLPRPDAAALHDAAGDCLLLLDMIENMAAQDLTVAQVNRARLLLLVALAAVLALLFVILRR